MHENQYEFEYGQTVRLHLDALLVLVQIIISSMLSQAISLFISSCFVGSDLCSQSGFTFLDQSKGEIGSIFREIEYGSAGHYI